MGLELLRQETGLEERDLVLKSVDSDFCLPLKVCRNHLSFGLKLRVFVDRRLRLGEFVVL